MADDSTIPGDEKATLTGEHAAFLRAQAIDIDLALRLGVRSLTGRDDTQDLGGVWVNWANFPALLFPWTGVDGQISYQVRPDNPTEDARGRLRKYVFAKESVPVLWAVRPAEQPKRILIVEGTKQGLAAASHAPAGDAVYAIAGIRMWQIDGAPIPDLAIVDGHEVIVIPDADAGENVDVYQACTALAQALAMEGAEKVSFGRLPAGGKSGLDDVLGARPANRRAAFLARLLDGAKPKPADKPPVRKKKPADMPSGEDGRVTVIVNQDRLTVINNLTGALLQRWNARELFNHGGVISWRRGDTMKPVDKGSFNDLVQVTAVTVSENEGAQGTTYGYAWPDSQTMAATMSRADQFAGLDRIAHAPFVREDGSIVTEPGYDEITKTLLLPDEVFAGIEIPDTPTGEEVTAARRLLLEEWLGDFPFDSDTDRANVMALIVTPAIRGLCPKVPLAVIDGLQMGVGKNLLADSLLTVYTGEAARPMNWVDDTEELRKQITSAFRTGQEFFVFDEAHTVEGAPLAQALTAATWQDRILGVSNMAEFPNRVTWMSLGNNVQVKGDLTRRVYRIALRPTYANPQDRLASSFRHPGQSGLDLGSWTRKHRRELMTAILILVRHWFAAGQPRATKGVSFGSFEIWERIAGGIVEAAGLTGFLDNLKVWRSESDFDTQYWTGHLRWLRDQFGDNSFRTAQVREKALSDSAGFMAPPKLDDPGDKGFGKALGEAYSRLRGRRYESLYIERVSSAHGHVSQWEVHDQGKGEDPVPPVTPSPEPGPKGCGRTVNECRVCEGVDCPPMPDPAPYNEHGDARGADESDLSGGETDAYPQGYPQSVDEAPDSDLDNDPDTDLDNGVGSSLEADLLTFDLETGDAADLYKADPATYIRIGATATNDRPITAYDQDPAWNVTADILRTRDMGVITGHNIMAFDLPALVRSRQMTMLDVHEMAKDGRIFDALLAARFIDPPMARDKGVDATRKYDLGTLGVTYDLGEKLSDVSKALAKKYGGWGEIPIDTADADPARAEDARAFQEYMIRDVELSRRLHGVLMEKLGGEVPEYLVREHRVAAVAAQISMNGFLVDQELLAQRVTEVNDRKAGSLKWLHEQCDIPLADAKGKAYKSPLASKAGKEALEAALRAAGATSLWRTGKSQDLDTSGDHMKHLASEYGYLPAVRAIAKEVYRVVSARSVYQTALDHLCPDGRVHPRIGFDQATGRWSVTGPGLTVFGKRNGRHIERAIFLPDPGEVLIAIDLSQVDMRAVAGLSQDQAYIRMLHEEDPHTELAIALFGSASSREEAKAIGHGWNYGESLQRISNDNEIEPAVVRRFDTSMRERFPRLVEWREEVRALASSGALLDNGFGRMMRPDPQRAHTQGPALEGQGAARDLMMTGMLNIADRLPEVLPMLRAQIHDEVVASVPADRAEEIGRAIVECFTFEWRGVPILADVSRAGTTWSGCYEKG